MPPLSPHVVLLRKAQEDARLALKLAEDPSVSDQHVGFFCQQAVEKAIKCVLSVQRIEYRRTHDLQELVGLMDANTIEYPVLLRSSPLLTPFAVVFRYDDLPSDQHDEEALNRNEAVQIAQAAVEWAAQVSRK